MNTFFYFMHPSEVFTQIRQFETVDEILNTLIHIFLLTNYNPLLVKK